MSSFIEIKTAGAQRRLINTRYIEEVVDMGSAGCRVFMAFSVPNAIDQDYFDVCQSYEEIVSLIMDGGGE